MRIHLSFWGARVLVVLIVVLMVAALNHIRYLVVPEEGFLETTQLVVLAVLLLLWLHLCYRLSRRPDEEASGLVSIGLGSAAIAFAGVGRETSWGEVYGASASLNAELKHISIVIFALLLLASIVNWLFRVPHRRTFLLRYFSSRMWRRVAFGIIAFILADRFERRSIPSTNPELYEEILELAAYLSVAWSAAGLWLRLRHGSYAGHLVVRKKL